MRLPVVALGLLLACSAPALAQRKTIEGWRRAFVATPNSWERRDLVLELDPYDPEHLDMLLQFVLRKQDWYLREAGVDVLARALRKRRGGGPLLETLKASDQTLIREATLLAMGRCGRREHVGWLRGQLDHANWTVRRAAVRALRWLPSKRAVGDLIDLWAREDKPLVRMEIATTLQRLTGERALFGVAAWRAWWDREEKGFQVKAPGDWKPAEPTWVTLGGVRLGYEYRGVGDDMPLLVLPELGYGVDYLEQSLLELEESSRVFYVTLPARADFLDPPLGGSPPTYPFERVVAAVEALQQKLLDDGAIKQRFALLAHGSACWIAMAYAARHPRSIRRMILVAAQSGTKAARQGLEALEARAREIHDVELEHYAQSRLVGDDGQARFEPKTPEEGSALDRAAFTARFFDLRNPDIGWTLGPLVDVKGADPMPALYRPLGCALPAFSLFDLKRTAAPTLVLVGERALETSAEDAEAIARHYGGNGRAIVFKRSAEMPFLEESGKFMAIAKRFLRITKSARATAKSSEQVELARIDRLQAEGMEAYKTWLRARRDGDPSEGGKNDLARAKLGEAVERLRRLLAKHQDASGMAVAGYEQYEARLQEIAAFLVDLEKGSR